MRGTEHRRPRGPWFPLFDAYALCREGGERDYALKLKPQPQVKAFITGIETDGGRLTAGTLFGDTAERLNARNVEEERDVAPREGRHRVLAITALNRLLWREKTQIEAVGLTINRERCRIAQ